MSETTDSATPQRPGWESGTKPWIRREPADSKLRCPFCGTFSLVRAMGDLPDPGRVELYCDNGACDARTMTVLLTQDGTAATVDRADVQALTAIDAGDAPASDLPRRFGDLDLTGADVIARRRTRPEQE